MPAGDAFEQGSGLVRCAVAAARKDLVQMQVRVHIGRDDQPAFQVDFLVRFGQVLADLLDYPLVDQNLAGFVLALIDTGVREPFMMSTYSV